MSELESSNIPNIEGRLKAARNSIRSAQEEVEEFFCPDTLPGRKEELREILLDKLAEPFEELGYLQGNQEGDDRAIDFLDDLLMGFVKYDPSKARLVTFAERVLRNRGIDDHRKRASRRKRAEDGFDHKLADITYANSLVEFTDRFNLVETIEEEIPKLRLEADRKIVTVLLDHLKQHGEIPSNLHISKVTGYCAAHVATRLMKTRMHLRSVILAKAERMEGVDTDALHLSF